jgi:von Willebrand factor type A domain
MLSVTLRFCAVLLFCITVFLTASPQSPRERQKPKPTPKAEPTADPTPAEGPQDIETLKIDTDLVTVPVIVTDASGLYVPDLIQADFSIAEDGVKQEIAFFGTVSAPFHVILMLDTSASTQEKLSLIQKAANAFVEQLQAADRVKVISFDDDVRDRNEFTSDRAVLRSAINDTRPGKGTKVYDAMELALNTIRRIQGRKAIVIFTDGVDWHSDQATFNSTVRGLDEEGVIVYPIRYETRAETEQIAREQSEETTPQLPTIDVIRRPTSGTTPPTFPSDEPFPTGTRRTTGPLGLPLPDEILRRRRQTDPNGRGSDPNRTPSPGGGPPDIDGARTRMPPGGPAGRPTSRTDDSLDSMLDMLYSTADSYLETLADKSGGKLLRADTLGSLPDAFAKIAAELRTQYLLGYYPINKVRDEHYRKIKVTSTRKSVFLRARPGYHAPSGR